ncbi:MAG TPA: hypothetical protein VFE53_06400 [Mucilaginibacter sp.]|jgi:hypothetical protein|nr:hypothetical protein [Mucilaginibacter sp.]
MIKEGEWEVCSKLDPRWNNKGVGYGDCTCVPDMNKWLEECKKQYGDPPDDTEVSFYKY